MIPVIEKHNRDGTFPADLIPEMAELGLFGANLHGYGCAGLNNVAYGLIMQELERGDSGLRRFVSVQGALVHVSDLRLRHPTRRRTSGSPAWRRESSSAASASPKPDFGSNPAGMRTRARARTGTATS